MPRRDADAQFLDQVNVNVQPQRRSQKFQTLDSDVGLKALRRTKFPRVRDGQDVSTPSSYLAQSPNMPSEVDLEGSFETRLRPTAYADKNDRPSGLQSPLEVQIGAGCEGFGYAGLALSSAMDQLSHRIVQAG
jgi:hypothetical protein